MSTGSSADGSGASSLTERRLVSSAPKRTVSSCFSYVFFGGVGVAGGGRCGRRSRGRAARARRRAAARGGAAVAIGAAGRALRGRLHDHGTLVVARVLDRICRLGAGERVLGGSEHLAPVGAVGRRHGHDDRRVRELAAVCVDVRGRHRRRRVGILRQHQRYGHQCGDQQDRRRPEAPLDELAPDVGDRAHRTPVVVAVGGVAEPASADAAGAAAAAEPLGGGAAPVTPCVGGTR